LGDANISAAAAIQASKIIQYWGIGHELANSTTAVTALTRLIHSTHGSTCALVAFQAFIITPATGADRTVSVDLRRSTLQGAFTTVLTSPISFTNTSAGLTVVSGVMSSLTLVVNDLLEIVVSVAGVAGNQALGLHAACFLSESIN
jgi:hypothetical protein